MFYLRVANATWHSFAGSTSRDLEGVRISYRGRAKDALREALIVSKEYAGAIQVPRPSSHAFVPWCVPVCPTGGVLYPNDTAGRTDAETCRVLRLTIGQTEHRDSDSSRPHFRRPAGGARTTKVVVGSGDGARRAAYARANRRGRQVFNV